MSKLLGSGHCPPDALDGLAVYKPERNGIETREMVEVLDKDGRVEDRLAPGHGSLKEYQEQGFTLRRVRVKTDQRGRMVR